MLHRFNSLLVGQASLGRCRVLVMSALAVVSLWGMSLVTAQAQGGEIGRAHV